jgi:hypothetical protein
MGLTKLTANHLTIGEPQARPETANICGLQVSSTLDTAFKAFG